MNFDAFLFSSELDLLELRLWETEDWADRWILVESERTHSGMPKPLFFLENRKRFERWLPRIQHHIAPLPQNDNDGRENAHRRELGMALSCLRVQPGDVIHTSDLDEIPAIDALKTWHADMGICGIEVPHSYYYLNCENGGWGAGRIGTWEQIITETGGDFQKLRHIGRDLHMLRALPDVPWSGGWHLSFMGGVEAIQRKMSWYLHSPRQGEERILDPRWLRFCTYTGVNLFYALHEREGVYFKTVEPRVLPRAIDKFRDLVTDARFDYRQTPAQLQALWSLMVKHEPKKPVDFHPTDGLTTLAMSSMNPRMIVHAVDPCNGPYLENVAEMGTIDSIVDMPNWPTGCDFVHVHRPEAVPVGLGNLVSGGIICGCWYGNRVAELVPGHGRIGDFWYGVKP
jgi:beta-1,4-mannosyl-glycoprotein beta-1,4-N-acetylglucosaminyltransferase